MALFSAWRILFSSSELSAISFCSYSRTVAQPPAEVSAMRISLLRDFSLSQISVTKELLTLEVQCFCNFAKSAAISSLNLNWILLPSLLNFKLTCSLTFKDKFSCSEIISDFKSCNLWSRYVLNKSKVSTKSCLG